MRNDTRVTHPAGSLGPGSRRNYNRTERHRQGNTLRLFVRRGTLDTYDWDEIAPRPKPNTDFAAPGRMAEVL